MSGDPHRLKATLTPVGTLRGVFSSLEHLSANLSIERIIQNRTYEGPYEVDPSFETQMLETNAKIMADDVTVHPIMVSKTTNLAGGITVYIGGTI